MKNYMKNAVFIICGLFLVTVSLFAGAVQNIPLRKSHDTEGNRSIAPISAFIDGTSLYSSFLGVTGIVEIVITSKSTGEVVCQKNYCYCTA